MAEAKSKKVPALRITSKPAQFRRAGLEFSREPRTVPLSALNKAQVEQLRAESMLVVEDVEAEAAE